MDYKFGSYQISLCMPSNHHLTFYMHPQFFQGRKQKRELGIFELVERANSTKLEKSNQARKSSLRSRDRTQFREPDTIPHPASPHNRSNPLENQVYNHLEFGHQASLQVGIPKGIHPLPQVELSSLKLGSYL